jgi:hypothetical protein
MAESSVHSTLLSDGYAAFNNDDWAAVEELFCDDTPNSDKPEFPVFYPMHHQHDEEPPKPPPDPLRGRAAIVGHLQSLRGQKLKAKLVGVADHGHTAVTLDISTGGHEGDHACADEVLFDDTGRIKSFRHCAAGLHPAEPPSSP